jgi:hypothetical protein
LALIPIGCSSFPAECEELSECCAKTAARAQCEQALEAAEGSDGLELACKSALDTYRSAGVCRRGASVGDGGAAGDGGATGDGGGAACDSLDRCCRGLGSAGEQLTCVRLVSEYRGLASGEEGCASTLGLYVQSGACVVAGQPGPEDRDATCGDGIDNDNNGHTDCQDWSCSWSPAVTVCPHEITDRDCSDGIDNDNNGYVDCADYSCSRNPNVQVCTR